MLSETDITPDLSISSPIDGYVGSVETSLGDYVQPDNALIRLLDLTDVHLTMKFLESDLGKIQEHLPLSASTQAFPGQVYTGSIHIIGKELDEHNLVEVHAHFDQEYPELIPGMFMNVKVHSKKTAVYTLPTKAINQFGSHQYVFEAVNNQTFIPVKVTTGITENELTEIRSGIDPSKNYVVNGSYALLMQWKNVSEEE